MSTKTKTESVAVALPLSEQMATLDNIAKDCALSAQAGETPFSAALKTADAIVSLRKALTTDVMRCVMELMNSRIGFLTDRTGKPNWKGETKPLYTPDEIRDAIIEATLRGFHVVGNEFNVIAGNFYAAKAGLRRKVQTFPGVSEFRDIYDVPRIVGDKGAIVKCRASWKLNGVEDSLEAEFAVKGDSYATADAYAGKAERKLLNRVHSRLTGIHLPEGEVGEDPAPTALPAPVAPVFAKPVSQEIPLPQKPAPGAFELKADDGIDQRPALERVEQKLRDTQITDEEFMQALESFRLVKKGDFLPDVPEKVLRESLADWSAIQIAVDNIRGTAK